MDRQPTPSRLAPCPRPISKAPSGRVLFDIAFDFELAQVPYVDSGWFESDVRDPANDVALSEAASLLPLVVAHVSFA
jgi:hypothetical protein